MSQSHETTGTLLKRGPIEEKNNFIKRAILVETDEKYPQKLKFEFHKDRIDPLEFLKIGDRVKVTWNLRGNEWEGKHYINAVGWKIEVIGNETAPPPPPPAPKSEKPTASDDLPF